MSRTSARRLIGLLLAVAIGGLTFAAQAGAAAPTVAASAPITSGVPRFEPAPCAFKFAKDQQEGKTVTCGYAIVPERHANPGGKTIKLPVAVYKALSPTPAAEPIIFLQGGPSETSQILAEFLTGPYYRGLAANNDVIIFDQRGAGFAQPALDCPELSAGSGESRQALVRALAEPSFVDLLLQCRDRLVKQGIDLAAYTTTENAADVNDIRAVLGYAKMNLYGASYGSELGLAVERDFPQFVRSAALASIVPLGPNYALGEQALNFDRVLRLLFQTCAADAACNAAYPDLKGSFQRAVARLNATPAPVPLLDLQTGQPLKDPRTGQPITVPVNGMLFSEILFNLYYSTEIIPFLPDLVARVERSNPPILSLVVSELVQAPSLLSYGMFFSVVCTHDFTPSRRDRLLAADQQILPEARAALEPGVLAYFEICPQWPSRDADPKAGVPASSAAPTLLVNGQFDPITPPAYGERAAQTLSKSVVVTLPGGGHAPTWFSASPVGQCGEAIVLRFFADPSKSPDTNCVAALRLTFQALPPELAGPSPAPAPTPTPAPTAVVPGLPNTGAGGSLRAAPDADSGAAPTEGEAWTLPLALGALGAMAAIPILVRRWRRARWAW